MMLVLLDGASLSDKQDLPPEMATLSGLQTVAVAHARFDKDVETLIETVDRTGRIKKGIAETFERLLRMGKAALAVAAVVASVMISFAWANILDLLGFDTGTAAFTMLVGDVFAAPLHRDLVQVGIMPGAQEVNELAPSRRVD